MPARHMALGKELLLYEGQRKASTGSRGRGRISDEGGWCKQVPPTQIQDKLQDGKCEKNRSPPTGFISDRRVHSHKALGGQSMGVFE